MTTEAQEIFLRGARLKLDGQRLIDEGQADMEQAAWMLVDDGQCKTSIPDMLRGWLVDARITSFEALGVSRHTVAKWLVPRHRPKEKS